MAEQESSGQSDNDKVMTDSGDQKVPADGETLECPICLQNCVHPVELPCRHIFCFLCIKGVAMQGPHGRCAICRSTIPTNVLTHPRLKDISQLYKEPKGSDYQWFYEARAGGWWQYEERSMQELERAYQSGQRSCQLLIAGHLYDIDFGQMIQFRANNRNMFRRIKRDVATAEKRGIAGIRLNGAASDEPNGQAPTVQQPWSRRRRGHAPTTHSENGHGNAADATTATTPNDNTSDDDIVEVESEEDDEDYDASDSLDDEAEEEMALAEGDETDGEDEEPARDGARAPTRRSDRSTPSRDGSPPGRTGSGGGNGGRYWRRRLGSRTGGSPEEETETNASSGSRRASSATSGGNNGDSSATMSSPLGSTTVTTAAPLTCILVGPGVRITLHANEEEEEEIL